MLQKACARRSGFAWRTPYESILACTMELQVGTAAAFKAMRRGEEAHDRSALLAAFPLLDRVTELAGGSEGKLALPGDANAKRAGEASEGRAYLDALRSVDVMRPLGGAAADGRVTIEIPPPTADELQTHERDRPAPGSRWWKWTSPDDVAWLDSVSFRPSGKLPALSDVSVLLSSRGANGVTHVCEETLHKLPAAKGELLFVSDGVATLSGELLGNIKAFQLELFETSRSSSWPELAEVTVRLMTRQEATP